MRRQRVVSSVIASVGHEAHSNLLEVEFRNGRIYHYFGVPKSEFRKLLQAESIGGYFNEEIKPRYSGVRVKRPA